MILRSLCVGFVDIKIPLTFATLEGTLECCKWIGIVVTHGGSDGSKIGGERIPEPTII